MNEAGSGKLASPVSESPTLAEIEGDEVIYPISDNNAPLAELEQQLDPEIRDILENKEIADPEIYEYVVRVLTHPELASLRTRVQRFLVDYFTSKPYQEEVDLLIHFLFEDKIYEHEAFKYLSYLGVDALIKLITLYHVQIDELKEILSLYVELIRDENDEHYFEQYFLDPSLFARGDQLNMEKYKKYLGLLSNKEICDALLLHAQEFASFETIIQKGLINSIIPDIKAGQIGEYVIIAKQIKSILRNSSFFNDSLPLYSLINRGVDIKTAQTACNLINSLSYRTLTEEVKFAIEHMCDDLDPFACVVFLSATMTSRDFLEFNGYIQLALVKLFDGNNAAQIIEMLKIYKADERFVNKSKNRSIGLYLTLSSIGLKSVDDIMKAMDIDDYISSLGIPDLELFSKELLPQLLPLSLEQAKQAAKEIGEIFIANNVPLFERQYLVFERLYFQTGTIFRETRFWKELKSRGSEANLSPFLRMLAENVNQLIEEGAVDKQNLSNVDAVKMVFWRDLLHIAIDSADQSLISFLTRLRENQAILDHVHVSKFQNVSDEEAIILTSFFQQIRTIQSQHIKNSKTDVLQNPGLTLSDQYRQLVELVGSADENIVDYLVDKYYSTAEYSTIKEILDRMNEVKSLAHERNLSSLRLLSKQGSSAESQVENRDDHHRTLTFAAGDLIKAANIDNCHSILQTGFKSREFLGSEGDTANSDRTPYDADFFRILPSDLQGHEHEIDLQSIIDNHYGGLSFVIRDRKQFYLSFEDNTNPEEVIDRYELIPSRLLGQRHYGVRTGIAATEIDAIVINGNLTDLQLQQLYFQIANNGFYIPVCDINGRVQFFIEDYQSNQLDSQLINSCLTVGQFSPDQLIQAFESCPYMKALYALDSGVSERYTLREHTLMVMTQFENYFANDYDLSAITKDNFRILLALHDIGKSLAAKDGKKFEQHEYSKRILQFALPAYGLSPKESEKLMAVADQDILGEYFVTATIESSQETEDSLEKAVRKIISLAKTLQTKPRELLELIRIYYVCDAGSYTADASGRKDKNNLGYIFQFGNSQGKPPVTFSEQYQPKFDKLAEAIERI